MSFKAVWGKITNFFTSSKHKHERYILWERFYIKIYSSEREYTKFNSFYRSSEFSYNHEW